MDFMISDTAVFGGRKKRDQEPELHIHPQVAAAMVGSAVVGGAISSRGAKSAANTQAAAADRATQSQREMFDTTVQNNAPYNQAGQGAIKRLSSLLGTSNENTASARTLSANDLIDTSSDTWKPNADLYASDPNYRAAWDKFTAWHQGQFGRGPATSAGSDVNTAASQLQSQFGYDLAAANAARQPAVQSPGQGDPTFGSLVKPFSMEDFHLDPGIQFQTEQGNKALMNSQAAKNGVLSGGALKDLIAYNQGMAGTGYQSAFDRYMAGKQFTLGSLMGVASLGQNAAANTGNNAATMSSGIAGSIMGGGNALAAGQVGSANALSGAASSAGNAYFLSSLMGGGGNTNLGGPITTQANPNGIYLAPIA